MDITQRIDDALTAAVASGESPDGPRRLASAVRYAVFPGGARIRPRLCLAVAMACGDDDPAAADAAATAIELLHCASLVHDDLPCFDDADTRRGRPTVHRAFGERLALLAGDALIVLAFDTLGRAALRSPARLAPLLSIVARATGAPDGIVAGQAWECEPRASLSTYHRAKTGALFGGATAAGAVAAGADPAIWRVLGDRLGEAYQLADDVRDVLCDAASLGKPVGRDAILGRPSAVTEYGMAGTLSRFEQVIARAIDAIPPCRGAEVLQAMIRAEALRLLPTELLRAAA